MGVKEPYSGYPCKGLGSHHVHGLSLFLTTYVCMLCSPYFARDYIHTGKSPCDCY